MALKVSAVSRFAIFISGTGSNLNAALEMRDHVDIGLVVSSRKKAIGILKARRAGVPVHTLSSPVDWKDLTEVLKTHRINFIFLLGFMKILPEEFIENWRGRILNIHPSLLPLHPGLESIRRSFEEKTKMGVTVHEVITEMDAGNAVLAKELKDTQIFKRYENLAESENEIHLGEHRLVREVLAKWNRAVILS